MTHRRLLAAVVFLLTAAACGDRAPRVAQSLTVQLNWLHDPSFAGEYLAASRDSLLKLRVGGPGITPMAELLGGHVDAAVVGADLFLQTLATGTASADSLICFFVDFQRNPVGWVLHPDAARKAGLAAPAVQDGKEMNQWLFQALREKRIRVGDKRGTETTAIWLLWRNLHELPNDVFVQPVGFDAAIVLTAPALAYPVYLNEEPFKLSYQIKRPIIEFDPADDGVRLYGNVLVTTRKVLARKDQPIARLASNLRDGWLKAQADPDSALAVVRRYYSGVPDSVLAKQIARTISFVTFGGTRPGVMDTTTTGLWATTLSAMQRAGTVPSTLSIQTVLRHVVSQ